MTTRLSLLVGLLCLSPCFFTDASANIPSAYFACEGAMEQEECQVPGPRFGNCVLDTLCEDPDQTEVNECLLCVDGCWGRPSGGPCRRFDGQKGVCEQQDRCTTDPDKSFNQCNRCVKLSTDTPEGGSNAGGDPTKDSPTPGGRVEETGSVGEGCSVAGQVAVTSWFFIIIAWVWQRRRENHRHQTDQ